MFDIEGWERITSEQFKEAYLATMKDIRDPDLDLKDKESNWSIVYNSIVNGINKESNEDIQQIPISTYPLENQLHRQYSAKGLPEHLLKESCHHPANG